jgi:hypothetical protein
MCDFFTVDLWYSSSINSKTHLKKDLRVIPSQTSKNKTKMSPWVENFNDHNYFIKEIESQYCVEYLCKTKKLTKIYFLRYWPVNRSYIEKYKSRLCSNKSSNRFLITLKVSKIKRYANFKIKNAMVCNISIPFVFFTNNFVNSPKKRPKNGQKTESCSRILVCHFTEKRSMRLFLKIEY